MKKCADILIPVNKSGNLQLHDLSRNCDGKRLNQDNVSELIVKIILKIIYFDLHSTLYILKED